MIKLLNLFVAIANSMAVIVATQSANGICLWHIYQPDIPKSVKALKDRESRRV